MEKYFLLIFLLYLAGCAGKKQSPVQLTVPESTVVFVDGDSLCSLNDFVHAQDQTMLCFVNTDCSACIVGMSLWLKFAGDHPGISPVFVTPSAGSRKVFWTQMLTYFKSPLYVIFDPEQKLARMNGWDEQVNSVLADSTGKVVLTGDIHDEKFSKQYRESIAAR